MPVRNGHRRKRSEKAGKLSPLAGWAREEIHVEITWKCVVFHRRSVTGGRIRSRSTLIHARWFIKERNRDRKSDVGSNCYIRELQKN
jgi:hypothetical protein